jgi:glycosyltransferase involved in cell wall biosynthesis
MRRTLRQGGAGAPLVSVVVPVYNVRDYVTACLTSLVGQTHTDLELLVVDDGSTDGSGEVAAGVVAADRRARVIRTPNQGLAAARDEGLAVAQGEFVVFVDSDDWVSPVFVECLVAGARRFGADIAHCGHWEVLGERRVARPITTTSGESCLPGQALRRMLLGQGGHLAAWNKIYRTRLFRDAGVCYPAGRLYEDAFTTYRLLHAANRVAYLPDLLYCYRRRPGSITQRPVDAQTVQDNLDMLGEMGAWLSGQRVGLEAEFDRFQVAARVHLLYRLAATPDAAGLWDPVAGWLVDHRADLLANSYVGWRTKAMLSLLARDRRAFCWATRRLHGWWHRR